jgi:hypothetical protein
MEKTITINPANTIPDKKLTQLNTAKKAAIQSILEKYNLKTPKKSKTNAVPVNYEIKPKDDNQIIHVSKSIPSTPIQESTRTQIAPRETKSLHPSPIPRPPAPIHTKPVQPSAQPSAQPSVPSGSSGSSILEKAKMVSVKDLLERDKVAKEAKKNEMPPAIINTNINGGSRGANSEGQGGKLNIYNFIPKVQPSLANTNTNKQVSSGGGNTISRGSNNSDSNNIKRVSINPNLNEEDSLNYNGRDSKLGHKSVNKTDSGIATQVLQEAAIARTQAARTPSPIRHMQHERLHSQERLHQQEKTVQNRSQPAQPVEHRHIQIQPISGGGGNSKQLRAIKAMQPQVQTEEETEGDNPGLRHLEAQRRELQKQQMLELQRFRHKKAEIIKLNNRKKEIELMRSIEDEKNKLRKIHSKQQELNEIYKSTIEKNTSSSIQSGGATMKKQVVFSNDVNIDIDAKRTKKNLANVAKVNRNKIIEPADSDHIKSGKLKEANVVDKVVLDKVVLDKHVEPETHDKVIEIVQVVSEQKDKTKDKSKEIKSQTQIVVKKELIPREGELLKYYTKKDKKMVIWPSKTELYDASKFEDTLDIFLGMSPFFNKKQIKNKTSHEIITKELKEDYGFKKLDKFKPALLDILYKIIVGDRIKFIFE